jgi:hypothetical protein
MAAMALLAAGRDTASAEGGETVFDGLSERVPSRAGIEVAEVVDLDELLADASPKVASRARAQLEEPTNIASDDLDSLSLPPSPASSAAQWSVAPARMPAAAMAIAERPVPAMAATTLGGDVPPARPRSTTHGPTRAMPSSSTSSSRGTPSGVPATWPATGSGSGRPERDDVTLRELTLAWFEARGYRSSPASMAVRPIELVLRHKNDPARAYAFVVEAAPVSKDRVRQLREQARSIGLMRLLIVAAGGAEPEAAAHVKGVRLMDASTVDSELDRLDFSIAAKIIAVARRRSQLAAVH